MSPNAWERAQRAISRAEKRDAAVVTPDNAVSPFDSSATVMFPQSDLPGQGRHQRPEDDATTEAYASGPTPVVPGRRRRPSPRPVPAEAPTSDDPADDLADETPTETVATSPDAPVRVRARPDTSPFGAVDGTDGAGADPEVVPDADPPRRGLWARLLRRR